MTPFLVVTVVHHPSTQSRDVACSQSKQLDAGDKGLLALTRTMHLQGECLVCCFWYDSLSHVPSLMMIKRIPTISGVGMGFEFFPGTSNRTLLMPPLLAE